MQQELRQRPIGVFDSGVGGLTVARAIRDLLPHESLIYLADTAHTPYGPRSIEQVRALSLKMLDQLVDEGVKLLVIACNTASTAVLRDAYERYSVPVVEVIQPTVRSAIALSQSGRIGLLGTETTVKSRVYDDFCAVHGSVTLTTQAAPKFVELVEKGITAGAQVEKIAAEYCAPLLAANIDTLVLGCTHYPFLRGALRAVVGPDIALVTSDLETANEVYRVLRDHDMLNELDTPVPKVRYKVSGKDTKHFQKLASQMLGIEINKIKTVKSQTV